MYGYRKFGLFQSQIRCSPSPLPQPVAWPLRVCPAPRALVLLLSSSTCSFFFYPESLLWHLKAWLGVLPQCFTTTCIFPIIILALLLFLSFHGLHPHPQLNYKILKSSDHVFSVQQDSDKFTKTKTGLLVPQYIAQHRNSMIMNEWTNEPNKPDLPRAGTSELEVPLQQPQGQGSSRESRTPPGSA